MYDIKWQRIWFIIVTLLGIAAVLFLVLMRGNSEDLAFSNGPCFLWSHCHLYCPTCGGTRAVKYLVEGELLNSLKANPFPVAAGVVIFRMWCALLYNCTAPARDVKMLPVLTTAEAWGIFAAVFGYAIVRDVLLVFFHVDFLGELAVYWR